LAGAGLEDHHAYRTLTRAALEVLLDVSRVAPVRLVRQLVKALVGAVDGRDVVLGKARAAAPALGALARDLLAADEVRGEALLGFGRDAVVAAVL
jgi:hypothetical protein